MTGTLGGEALRSGHLWVSAPGHVHGWTGEAARRARVLVFHFLAIPETLACRVPQKGCVGLRLSKQQQARLMEFSRFDWRQLNPAMLLRSEHLLLELSLMALDALDTGKPFGKDASLPAQRVRRALDWFDARMEENPGLDEVARAVGCSASQMRKHFYEVMQKAPKAIFDQLRLQRALQLLAAPEAKLAWVGQVCGFGDPSAFSRAFKAKMGVSPARWRGSKA